MIEYLEYLKKLDGIKNQNISNKELAEELQKPIIRNFEKRKVHSPLIDNIWGADLADMQLINKFNNKNQIILVALLGLIHGNLKECKYNVKKKLDLSIII